MGLDSLNPYRRNDDMKVNYDMRVTSKEERRDNINILDPKTTLPQNTEDILDRIDKICGKRLLIEESETLKSLLKNSPEKVPEYVAGISGKIISQDQVTQLTNLFEQFDMLIEREGTFSEKTGKEQLAEIIAKYKKRPTGSKGGTRCDELLNELEELKRKLSEEIPDAVPSNLTPDEVRTTEQVLINCQKRDEQTKE